MRAAIFRYGHAHSCKVKIDYPAKTIVTTTIVLVSMSQKVDTKDYFGLLISTAGLDTTGAVTIRREE